ncbi:MAG: ribulose-phosphate 3-epimerase [Negativicoccus succinicivorans]|uniref:ribulose-phosphate 3-epimerase n=1 Tax=Negativicoccus succinicivorans TaxID=620903 RepID=UPI0029145EFA|nr:ribulose-phosphate 3-epimerase [Negativicoccus succinicivorans]MDU4558126.1 ribulose-phosphate 3-epimerase [Negativicoccus succinicivorans]MDU4575833.1 ribulose-phosphate 3-epimerase [Negativicoccus succinicivorans]
MIKIAPSLLSADFSRLQEELKMLTQAGADIVHLDIMDGHFVPNLTFGPSVIKALRPHSDLVFDAHLMVEQPSDYIEPLDEAGCDMISFHYETEPHADRVVQLIKKHDMKAGMVLNPSTPVEVLQDILPTLDFVLLMSVNPGFGGQKFIPYVTAKVKRLAELIERTKSSAAIEIDGGVGPQNAAALIAAGANILVAGSAVFNSADRAEMIRTLRNSQ